MSPRELHDKKVLAEYRLGRRTHHFDVGRLNVVDSSVSLVFEERYIFPLCDEQISRLIPIQNESYDFRYNGLVDFEPGLSEDDGGWTQPPRIETISEEELEDEKS